MPEIILWIFIVSYLLAAAAVVYGMSKMRSDNNHSSQKFVSVLIAVRDEEEYIERCIQSLIKQSYPKDLYEIIVVDDHSTDGTAEKLQRFMASESNIRYFRTDDTIKLPPGKTRALVTGLRHCKGEIILQTDGDCIAPESWIAAMTSGFGEGTVMVNGATLPLAKGFFSGLQSLDFAFLHAVAAGMARAGLPLAGMGNNMSFTLTDYNKTGGYEGFDFSVTEDFALSRQFKKGGGGIKHLLTPESLIETVPLNAVKDFFRQKKRWIAGGMSGGVEFYLLFSIAALANLAVILSPFLLSNFAGVIIILKIAADIAILSVMLMKVKKLHYLRYFLIYELYLVFYILIFPVYLLFNRDIIWKGRSYSRTH